MADATKTNVGRYKAGFSNKAAYKDFIKHTPFKIERLGASVKQNPMGDTSMSYPTPINPHKV